MSACRGRRDWSEILSERAGLVTIVLRKISNWSWVLAEAEGICQDRFAGRKDHSRESARAEGEVFGMTS